METLTTFASDKESLPEVLRGIKGGKIQLPDFQRGWVWNDEHVRSLLASVSLSYPIGAVMLLDTGSVEVRFKPRLFEGVSLEHAQEPDQLILDGQQRLTSLFQALFSEEPALTRDARGKQIYRWYYLDIVKALDPYAEREDAIVGVPPDRIVRDFRGQVLADYSTVEKECAAEFLPLRLVLDVAGLTNWQMKYLQVAPEQAQERLARWNDLVLKIVQRYQQYQVPLILLRKETPKEAVCQVFEKVNTGGVSLTVFELLTATYAADDYPLREDWEGKKDARGKRVGSGRRDRLREHNALSSIESTDFLQAITLLATYFRKMEDPDRAVSCKRKDILRLALSDYQKWAEPVTQGFEKAAKLLRTQKIFGWRDLPYRTQIVPLAAILTALQDKAENDGVRAKLARWYWCGVFGELYGSAVESRFARDLPEVLAWIDGGPEPSTVAEANFAPARLLTLRTRNSAAYKGLHTLLLRDGGQDFRTGEPVDAQVYFDDKIDIHHVFPKNWCKTQGIEAGHYESIVNKIPLAARTNRIIGDKAPSAYLSGIQKSAGISEARMDET